MIFSKRTIRATFIPKIRKIHSGVWKLKAKNLQNCQFWPKNGQILATNGQILAISEFSRHIHYDFPKEDHTGNFHTKTIKLIAAFGGYRPKTLKNGYFGQKWPNLDHFWPLWGSNKFSTKKIFGGHLSHMETQLHAKKKYQTFKAVGPERTDGCTHERTRVNS